MSPGDKPHQVTEVCEVAPLDLLVTAARTPMLFQTPTGAGIHVSALAPKRAKIHLDKAALRIVRCRTFRACQLQGMSLEQIARAYDYSETTVSDDLKYLRDRQADGKNRLPWDDVPGESD